MKCTERFPLSEKEATIVEKLLQFLLEYGGFRHRSSTHESIVHIKNFQAANAAHGCECSFCMAFVFAAMFAANDKADTPNVSFSHLVVLQFFVFTSPPNKMVDVALFLREKNSTVHPADIRC